MLRIEQTLNWCGRAWPFILFFLICLGHQILLKLSGFESGDVDKAVALICQILGALIVIISIDSTIGILGGTTLWGIFKNFISEFPGLSPVKVTGSMSGSASISMTAKGNLSIESGASLEKRIGFLEAQLTSVQSELSDLSTEFQESQKQQKQEFKEQLDKTQDSTNKLEQKITTAAVGSVNPQIFGGLLVGYGAVTGYFA